MKRAIILLGMLAGFQMLAACNTMSGIGEDVEAGGDKLERTAEKHKGY
jgi:predicted small secreted protein